MRIKTLAQLRAVVDSGAGVVITDTAGEGMFHPSPAACPYFRERSFAEKVIVNAERNGAYFLAGSPAEAQENWPGVPSCSSAACAAAYALRVPLRVDDDGAPRDQARLAGLLREAVGLDSVRKRPHDPVGAEAMLGDAAESTQRIALGIRGDSLALCSWPGELKNQAEALYRTDRGARLVELVTADPTLSARPTPHLACFPSNPKRNLYFRCPMDLGEYVRRWSQTDDFDYVGGRHPSETLREDVWGWLVERGFAEPESPAEGELDAFVRHLGRREAHLRPGIEVERLWEWSDAVAADQRGDLVREIGDAVARLLAALRELLPVVAEGS